MARIDEPNISISKKTNEENMAVVKSYLSSISDYMSYLETRIVNLESAIAAMESEGD